MGRGPVTFSAVDQDVSAHKAHTSNLLSVAEHCGRVIGEQHYADVRPDQLVVRTPSLPLRNKWQAPSSPYVKSEVSPKMDWVENPRRILG